MLAQKIVVTESSINHSNSTKKRPRNISQWKSVAAKRLRNSGDPYVSKRGQVVPGIPQPPGVKVCLPNCRKAYCFLNAQRQQELHQDFWSTGNMEVRTAFLMGLIRKTKVENANGRRNATFRYYLPDEDGCHQEVCKTTLISVLGITKYQVEGIQERISSGKLNAQDSRGIHLNRPHTIDPIVIQDIIDHINSFPAELSHYTRMNGNPQRKYLDKNLTLRSMYDLYKATVGLNDDSQLWIYRRELRKTGLTFGLPRADTCAVCDKFYIQQTHTNNPAILNQLDLDSILHHSISDSAYEELRKDTDRNSNDPNFHLLTFDLQQVLFCPQLTHSNFFYQRKYSCYNFAVTSPTGTNSTKFFFWHEQIASRGSAEIASCLLKMIQDSFQPLAPGVKRILTTYSDRCGGQNCNWNIVCVLRLFVLRNYFTEVVHKFLATGHSFLPCDREFAAIEYKKKSSAVYGPSDYVKIIQQARATNQVTEMQQADFKAFDIFSRAYRKPTTLRLTEVLGYRILASQPNKIFSRLTHEPGTRWESHNLDTRFPNLANIQLPPKYTALLPIPTAKKADLLHMCDFIPPQYRNFYQNL